jgi:hypothetical protein
VIAPVGPGTIVGVRRRNSKATDVYERPSAGTTLQTSGRRIPLRHSDAPDYDALTVSDEQPPSRRRLWLLVTLLVVAGLAAAAWRALG